MEFEWDDDKGESNLRKHGVSFPEAQTVLADPHALTGYDPDHSARENRFITLGFSLGGRILVVSHNDRGDRVRIICAREATAEYGRTTKMPASLDAPKPADDEIRPEYDFDAMREVVPGKYADR